MIGLFLCHASIEIILNLFEVSWKCFAEHVTCDKHVCSSFLRSNGETCFESKYHIILRGGSGHVKLPQLPPLRFFSFVPIEGMFRKFVKYKIKKYIYKISSL